VGGTTLVPAGGGVANFTNLPITAAGSYTITATDNNHTLWTATTNSFTVTFAAPSKVIWTIEPTPTTSIAGSPVVGPPTVEVEDTYNNPVKSATVNMAVTTGPPLAVVVSGGSVTTGTNGIATFSSLVLGVAGNYTITASVAGGAPSSVPSNSFAVTAGAATAVMVWGGNGQSAAISTNFSSPLSAFVVDAEGNPVSGATVTFTAPPSGVGGAFAAGCATNLNSYTCGVTTNSSGIAKSSTLTANTLVGPFSVTATITGGVSTPFSETNTTGTFVILTSPQTFATSSTGPGATSGSVIIQAQDGNHNPVVQTSALPVALAYATTGVTLTTDPSTVTIPVGASSVAFTIVSNTSSAGGTFTITATGAYVTATQTETVLQNASATGNAFTAIAAQTVSPTSQPATFPVTMTNNNGATTYYKVSSVDGLITGESASPSSACLTITNTNNGTINETVTTDETLPSPSRPSGSYTLDFIVQVYTAAGCGTGTPINLQVDATLTVIAGSASTVAIVRGAGQFTTHSTAFTSPLTAVVLDADGNPVSGVLVTFAAPSSGASGVFAACTSNPNSYTCVATTNAEGVATASTFTANATIGNYYVQVTTAPTTSPSPLNFAEDNT
jgi:adhesin/invasin